MLSPVSSAVAPPPLLSCVTPASAALPPRRRRLARWVTEAVAAEVPGVRASMRRSLEEWGVPSGCVEDLLLIGTELLSNAVRHAGGAAGRPCVTVTRDGGLLQLDVADGDRRLPCVGLDAGAEAEGGRGLLIVRVLVSRAGGELSAFPVASGKVVRVRIPAT
ncbi:ATP-binding protein [Streptomyces sp. NPDC020800]|uniref:ATP-binding protein n=1 Tax=Streptomyces sp. NPDC020800 TaxID=3365092 RepID=UPI00379DE29D